MLFSSVFSRFAVCLPHGRRKRHAALALGFARQTGEGNAAGRFAGRRYSRSGERLRFFRSAGGFRQRFRADSLDVLEDAADVECSYDGGRRLSRGHEEGEGGWDGPGVLVLSFVFGCLLGMGVLGAMLLFDLGGF